MQLSRLGQGLATSAVSALLISGLAVMSPAHAAEGPGVRLLSQQDGIASVRQDGDAFFISTPARTVTLTAENLLPDASVTFEYNADPAADDSAAGWTAMVPTSVTVQGRYVSHAWLPDPSLIGTTVAIRAVAATPATGDSPATATYSRRNDVQISDEAEAVTLVNGGLPGPFFVQPYADSGRTGSLLAVRGTTSATDGTVALSVWDPAVAEFRGQVDAAVSPTSFKVGGGETSYIDGGRFSHVFDLTGYDADAGDALAVRAERESDEVFPALLSQQEITSIEAFAPPVAAPADNAVAIQVNDLNGVPVVGAEVRRGSDGALVGYTDVRGSTTAQQASGTTETYYANTTDVDAYEEGTDLTTGDVTIPDYVPVATSTVAELADGTVFDDREYAEGDIALQVVDGRGDAVAGEQEIQYALTVPGEAPPAPVTTTTDEAGRFVVPFDPADEDGEYVLDFTAPASAGGGSEDAVSFVAGDAVLGLTPLAGTAASGGQITYDGSLAVEGRPLAGRDLDLLYTRGTEQAPGTEADASLVLGADRALTGAASTDEDGAFRVVVADVEETGSPAETGGTLQVTARGLGDTVRATADFAAVVVAPTTTPSPTSTPSPVSTPTPAPTTGKGRVELRLKGADARDGSDRLRVRGPARAAGARVRVHVLTAGGFWRVLKGVDLDAKGDAALTVPDRNGEKVTRYRVRLIPNPRFKAFTSAVLRLR